MYTFIAQRPKQKPHVVETKAGKGLETNSMPRSSKTMRPLLSRSQQCSHSRETEVRYHESVEIYANATAKPRLKQPHSKVRSGCDTCKRRRVKRDEAKPNCRRCLHAGRECLGYNVPETWMFDGGSPKTPTVHRDEHGSVDSELAEDADVVDMQAKELLAQQESPSLVSVNPSFGGGPDERRSLDYWLDQTGPTVANYGPNFGFWCGLIPMWAWRSDIIRHLLVATTLSDQQLGLYRTATSSDLSPPVIWHYHAAIQRMATATQPDKFCWTPASMLAWVFELLQKDYSAAKIHVQAASRLLSELEAPSNKLEKSMLGLLTEIKSVVQHCASYTKAICEDNFDLLKTLADEPIVARTEDLIIPPVQSLIHARDLLLDSISRYLASEKTDHSAQLQRLYIKSWLKATRSYCSRSTREPHVYKKTVQLCFNLGMAFLPESEAGTFSCQATPNAVEHLLEAYERLVVEKQTRGSGPDNDSIDEMIVMALELIIGQVHHVHLRARAALLLQKLTAHHEKVAIHPGWPDGTFD